MVLQEVQDVQVLTKKQADCFKAEKASLDAQLQDCKLQAQRGAAATAEQLSDVAAQHSARKVK